MPTPNDGEKQGHFISRCLRMVMGEGKGQKAALGECYGIWRQHRGGDKPAAKSFDDVIKQPTVQSVHVGGSGGRDKKRRGFNQVLAEQTQTTVRDPAEGHEPAEDPAEDESEYDQDIVRGVKPTNTPRQRGAIHERRRMFDDTPPQRTPKLPSPTELRAARRDARSGLKEISVT
jgi:hypothetical protein